MRIILLLVFSCVVAVASVEDATAQGSSAPSAKALADSAIKLSTWEIQPQPDGELMFLDMPYKNIDKTSYVTLTVSKKIKMERPDFISVIVPGDIVDTNQGIYIAFANDTIKNGKRDLAIAKDQRVHLKFENVNSEFCTARIIGGYSFNKETNKTSDIFGYFMNYDYVLVLFYDFLGHKTVVAPLGRFKKQYKALK